jgi:hypothetical protein
MSIILPALAIIMLASYVFMVMACMSYRRKLWEPEYIFALLILGLTSIGLDMNHYSVWYMVAILWASLTAAFWGKVVYGQSKPSQWFDWSILALLAAAEIYYNGVSFIFPCALAGAMIFGYNFGKYECSSRY